MKIAIDGPAGSGKSTVAKAVAQKLGFKHIDTGSFYRWLTYHYLQKNSNITEPAAVTIATQLDYTNIDESKIRTTKVTNNVSQIAALPLVRKIIVEQQRLLAKSLDVVMEGRDIGSVVFPDAELKIFLTANSQERARRRYAEFCTTNPGITLAEVEQSIIERDQIDSSREASPLVKTADAKEVDTSGLTIDEVVERIVALAQVQQKEE